MRLVVSAALLSLALAACQDHTMSRSNPNRGNIPLSQAVIEELGTRGMSRTSPVLMRIFKEEAELEVWKKDGTGRYALFRTYPICNYSGELGPKVREGDRQSPEGFYQINMGLMNPRSSYFLAFNMGFPNQFDRAHGRTGSHLMVHGDCSSRGCYAMTDEAIAEVYALARDALQAGQESFQVQAYPFRMTPRNLARHRNNPNMPFWRNLKEGYDHFEVTRREPQVDVCERRYVFNAVAPTSALAQADGAATTREMIANDPWAGTRRPGTTRASVTTAATPRAPVPASVNQPVTTVAPVTRAAPAAPARSIRARFTAVSEDGQRPSFQPAGRCPAYVVPPAIRQAVAAKHARDMAQVAVLSREVAAAPARTGIDGGTHQRFADRFAHRRIRIGSSSQSSFSLASADSAPAAPQAEAAASASPAALEASVATTIAAAPVPVPSPLRSTTVARAAGEGTLAAAPVAAYAAAEPAAAGGSGNWLARVVGAGGADSSGNWFTRMIGSAPQPAPAAAEPVAAAAASAVPAPQPQGAAAR